MQEDAVGDRLEFAIAVLNGLVGDHLAREDNGLATAMGLYHDGQPVPATRAGFASAYPEATGRVAVLVHGIMCTETIWRFPDGSDYGSRLQGDLGITPLYVRYNSGRSIADNGRDLARLLEQVVEHFPVPVERLVLLGYSMGGLLVRSATHVADEEGLSWLDRVERALYVATPHAGAPAERLGRVVAKVLGAVPDPTTRLIGQIGDLRSAGIKDLGDADLRPGDRAAADGRLSLFDLRHPVPLSPRFPHHLVAGSLSVSPAVAALFGDAIVPVSSARGDGLVKLDPEVLPPGHVVVLEGRTHYGLSHDEGVYEALHTWLEAADA